MRWQVEHGITEMVSGLDLVEMQLQLQVPGLEAPDMSKAEYTPSGWAMEARLNAEDPLRNFLPSAGMLGAVSFPLKDSGAHFGAVTSVSL